MRVAPFNILHGRSVGDGVHPQQLNARSVNTRSRCRRLPGLCTVVIVKSMLDALYVVQ